MHINLDMPPKDARLFLDRLQYVPLTPESTRAVTHVENGVRRALKLDEEAQIKGLEHFQWVLSVWRVDDRRTTVTVDVVAAQRYVDLVAWRRAIEESVPDHYVEWNYV